jgi:hypothetical protein
LELVEVEKDPRVETVHAGLVAVEADLGIKIIFKWFQVSPTQWLLALAEQGHYTRTQQQLEMAEIVIS